MVIYVVSEIAHLGKNDDNDASNNLNLRYKIKHKIEKNWNTNFQVLEVKYIQNETKDFPTYQVHYAPHLDLVLVRVSQSPHLFKSIEWDVTTTH